MSTSDAIISGTQALSVALAGMAALRMQLSGLRSRYRFLFAYLWFLVPYGIIPLAIPVNSILYYRCWLFSEPLSWMFEILVVREICGLVLQRYRGLCSLGRWSMYAGLAISASISTALLLPHIHSQAFERSALLYYMEGAGRGVNFALALFLLLMLLLGSRYPVPLSRNVILNAVVFTVLFLCNTMGMLLYTVFDLRTPVWIGMLLSFIAAASEGVWLLALTPKGETELLEVAHMPPRNEERLLSHLQTINEMLLRLAAK